MTQPRKPKFTDHHKSRRMLHDGAYVDHTPDGDEEGPTLDLGPEMPGIDELTFLREQEQLKPSSFAAMLIGQESQRIEASAIQTLFPLLRANNKAMNLELAPIRYETSYENFELVVASALRRIGLTDVTLKMGTPCRNIKIPPKLSIHITEGSVTNDIYNAAQERMAWAHQWRLDHPSFDLGD